MGRGTENGINSAVGGHSTHRKEKRRGAGNKHENTVLDGSRLSVGSWGMLKIEGGVQHEI